MKFSANGYYVEKYRKCGNCGALMYDHGLNLDGSVAPDGAEIEFCSAWCIDWFASKEIRNENKTLVAVKDWRVEGA